MKTFFKVLEIVLIVLLLAGVVYGVLYFLRACEVSKKPNEPVDLGDFYILIADFDDGELQPVQADTAIESKTYFIAFSSDDGFVEPKGNTSYNITNASGEISTFDLAVSEDNGSTILYSMEFSFNVGMTWSDWVSSEYNVHDFSVYAGYVVLNRR